MKRLQRAVQDYLTMRRGLGFKMARHEVGLRDFVSFLERKRSPHITVKLALEWATQHVHHTPGEWAMRLTVVRGFARHWSATDPLTEVPPLGLLPFRPQRAQPYFYSHQKSENCCTRPKRDLPLTPCAPGPITACLDCWQSPVSAWVRRSTSASETSTGPKIFSRSGAPSSESPAWYRCMPQPVRSSPIMRNAGTALWRPRRRTFPGEQERQPTRQRRGAPGVLHLVPADWVAWCGRQPRTAPARFSTPICGPDAVALVSQR